MAEKVKADDPRELRKRIADLEKELQIALSEVRVSRLHIPSGHGGSR